MRWPILIASVALAAAHLSGAEMKKSEEPAATAPEPEITLEGVVVERPGVGFMTVTMNGQSLVLRFYDEKKKAVPPDVDRAVVRILPAGRTPERRVLIPSPDGQYLTHGLPLRAPHVFKLIITLVRDNVPESESPEVYTIEYP